MKNLKIQLPPGVADLVDSHALQNYGRLASGQEPLDLVDRRSQLADYSTEDLFAAKTINHPLGECFRSGLWLLLGDLDRSHEISQSINLAEGSFGHAIMHRLEGDFGNSKYVGQHSVISARQAADPNYPSALVDLAQQAMAGQNRSQVAPQAIEEWIELFEYCYTGATG